MILLPFGTCNPSSVKNSSRKTCSSVAIPFKKPAIFPVFLSTATKNSSGAFAMRANMCSLEHASCGGKQIRSMSAACSASSCRIVRNKNCSFSIKSSAPFCIQLFFPKNACNTSPNASGHSVFTSCPARGRIASCARGIRSFNFNAAARFALSFSPQTTSVQQCTLRKSCPKSKCIIDLESFITSAFPNPIP